LDVLPISWTSNSGAEERVCGTLLEVWPSGGVIQTEEPIAKGETFKIGVNGTQLEARVENYEQDEYGCYLQFGLAEPWFPENYQPAYLMRLKSHEETESGGGKSSGQRPVELRHTISV
jgi:hypothetical protein